MSPVATALHRLVFSTLRAVTLSVFLAAAGAANTAGATDAAGAANAAGAAQETLKIDHAEFRAEGLTSSLRVALPDTWVQRGQPAGGIGHYRMRFTLTAAVDEVWALRAERLSTAHELRLNGRLVHGSLYTAPQLKRPVQTLIPLPPHLLREGDNTLDIVIHTGVNAGLSAVTLGPALALATEFQRSQQREVALPQMLNIAGASVSLFMLLLWLRRRSETVLGSFGALGLLASLRNYAYFEPGTVLPSPVASWLYMMAQLLTVLLLGIFAMAFAGHRTRWYRRVLVVVALLFFGCSLWALWADALQAARQWLYPLLLLLVVAALGLVAQAAVHRRSAIEMTLAASLSGVLGAGIHDYLYQLGHLSVMGSFWTPYAVPLMLAAFSALLLKRLQLALEGAER